MKDRIEKFLEAERISPAEFADKIGVQRSSMSHILNGRNYPSAAFIQKMLQAYPMVNSRWLMIGEGTMNTGSPELKSDSDKLIASIPEVQISKAQEEVGLQTTIENSGKTGTLFAPEPDKNPVEANQINSGIQASDNQENVLFVQKKLPDTVQPEEKAQGERSTSNPPFFPPNNVDDKEIEQVLFFYKDKTFSVYRPS
jgi:transcriptional regulator with XRE-family HTH domain